MVAAVAGVLLAASAVVAGAGRWLLRGFASGVLALAAGLAVVAILPPAALAANGSGNVSQPASGSATLRADPIVPATFTGHYYDDGSHVSTNPNYLAGINKSYGIRSRNFFVFNMAGLPSPICTATLQAGNQPAGGAPPGGIYSLYAVTTSIADLTATHDPGPAGQAIYTDLGDGTVYGSVTLSDTQVTANPISVTFNSYGIAALNRALAVGSFAVGGDFASSGYIFGGSPYGVQQLVYETCTGPKGASVTLAGLSLAVQGIGPGASLSSKVAHARAELAAGHITAVRNTVAAFIREVRAQTGKTITQGTASQLIAIANRVQALLA